MKHRVQVGPEYESLEFQRSAAYADYKAALASVGCQTYVLLLDQPRAVRDRFHTVWRERMQQRCGIAPDREAPAPNQRTARTLGGKSHRTRQRVLDALPLASEPPVRQHDIAEAARLSLAEVRRNLRELERTGHVVMRTSQRLGPGRGQRLVYLYHQAA